MNASNDLVIVFHICNHFFIFDKQSYLKSLQLRISGNAIGTKLENKTKVKDDKQVLNFPVLLLDESIDTLKSLGKICIVDSEGLTYLGNSIDINEREAKKRKSDIINNKYVDTLLAPLDIQSLIQNFLSHVSDFTSVEVINEYLSITSKAYNDLYNKGYWLTNGSKFGVNFLAYRTNPSESHACYMVKCLKIDEKLPANELIALSRVATAANKQILYCIPQKGENGITITFLLFDWIG